MVVTGTDVYQNPMVYHNLFIEETILGVSGYPSYQNLPELSEGESLRKTYI